MTMAPSFDALLDAVELDLLCTFAGVVAPYPLRVRSVGATQTERRAIFRAARDRLADRGLADAGGPLGVAEIFVHLLRNSPATLDLTLAIGADRLGAVLLSARGEAVLAVADLADPNRTARLVALGIDDAVDELLLLIPALDAAMSSPISLPRRGLDGVYRALLGRSAPMGPHELDELAAAHGIDGRAARWLTTRLRPVLGSGQAGRTERSGYAGDWHRVGDELRWLDTGQGRFRLAGDSEWTSVNPLFADELAAGVRRLAAALES